MQEIAQNQFPFFFSFFSYYIWLGFSCGDELSENAELKKPYSYEDCHRVSTVFINDASGDTSKEAVNTGVLKYLKELQYLDWTQHPEVGVKVSFIL